MSKHPNPIRGHVRCPVCSTPSTVHRVGEGKLIAEGEPTKNGRNLGLHYYRCPNCGNSAMSKTIDSYIVEHMVSDESQLTAMSTETVQPLEIEPQPDVLTVDSVDSLVDVLLANEMREPSNDAVVSALSTVEPTVKTPVEPLPFFTVKRALALLSALIFLVWMLSKLLPKKQPEAQPNANV
ncbi:hypothetical protein VCSRO84_3422 [Vibrio cholerae]|uniref:hypothetical protein n=1 Tax=Vibrio cholerae TaxID=666 RepID=UPI0011D948FC|nr:hypothetical protein [Vibrio cholerae]TXZ21627.1 hypothetical protein FXE70_09775 [Vibrio cholerae]GIA21432.1 hypothetical protein VCSRO84_3422 [Vibrio cholerae]